MTQCGGQSVIISAMNRRGLVSDIVSGALAGAILFGAFFVLALVLAPGMAYMASKDARVAEIVARDFRELLVTYNLKILAASFLVGGLSGAGVGVLAGTFLRLRRDRPSFAARLALSAGGVLVIEALALASGVIRHPQLYAEALFAQGGARAAIQAFLTDRVPPIVPEALLALLAVAAVVVLAVRLLRGVRLPRVVGFAALPVLAAIATGLVLPVGVPVHTADPARPNILIVGVDSLRPDAVTERTAPNLVRLAREGAFLANAVVPLARTFPSWVSLLTGTTPNVHGVRNMFPRREERDLPVPALPAILRDRGWQTAVLSDYAGDIFPRIDLGFDVVDAPRFDFATMIQQRLIERQVALLPFLSNRAGRAAFPVLEELAQNADPAWVVDKFRTFLRNADPAAPFFATVFLSVSHFPYSAPYPWYARFADPAYGGPFKYYKPPLDAGGPPSPADAAQVRALYDGSVAAADDAIARILDLLDASGVAKDTIVVVLADHGEALYDDGRSMGHGDSLKGRASYTIPILVRAPGIAPLPAPVTTLVRSIDVAPTLLDLAGVPAPASFAGVSLRPRLEGHAGLPGLQAFAETGLWFVHVPGEPYADERVEYPELTELLEIDADHGSEIVLQADYTQLTNLAKYRMVQDDRWKLVYVPTRTGRVLWELYDLAADPDETRDLAGTADPAVLDPLKADLFRWMLLEKGVILRNEILIPE